MNPPVECGECWPPVGIEPFDPYGIPIVNSFILVTSGISITLRHHYLLQGKNIMRLNYIYVTIFLGLVFTFFQGLEYYYASFSFSDAVYGSLFFIITGFHGLHVIIGTIFLITCL